MLKNVTLSVSAIGSSALKPSRHLRRERFCRLSVSAIGSSALKPCRPSSKKPASKLSVSAIGSSALKHCREWPLHDCPQLSVSAIGSSALKPSRYSISACESPAFSIRHRIECLETPSPPPRRRTLATFSIRHRIECLETGNIWTVHYRKNAFQYPPSDRVP